jgi:3-mercaptopyruvate sulfurtransferase SseA
MSEKIMKKSRVLMATLLGTVMIAALTLWGCGTSSYDDPNASITTTKTASALIDAATLKQWMDEGKVNSTDPSAKDRVVIVTVATAAQYNTQHIPGSLLLDSGTELNMTRLEGVAPISTMVIDGPSIDNLVKKLCINENTTIVFVASKGQNALNPARAYFTFRYWGFPKERLKILNGGENGWETAATTGTWAASYALNATVPTVTPSTFSVRNLYAGSTTNFNMRTSIGEMISVVDKVNAATLTTGPTGVVSILDARGGAPTTYIANAGVDDFAQYAESAAGSTSTYKATSDLIARLGTFSVTSAKTMNYVYCASGVRASSVFFVLDGILGWPTTLYDGSWNQWSAYRAQTAPAVSPGNAWLITNNSPTTVLPRTTIGAAVLAGTLTVDTTANILYTNIADPRANQILNEDKAYFTSGGTTTAPSTGGGTGGGSGC